MVLVGLGVDDVFRRIGDGGGGVGVAAVNGRSSVVVSGGVRAVEGFVEGCVVDGVRAG